MSVIELVGRRGFFTDANSCISREAWTRVPFREVPYAEDRVLAIDMLRAGYAKAYVPDAAVSHSHQYTTSQHLRRSFDEARALREVYGWSEPVSPPELLRRLRGELGAARRELPSGPGSGRAAALAEIAAHHLARLLGAVLGGRAQALPVAVRRRLSLEGRDGFAALHLDDERGRAAVDPGSGSRGAGS